MENTINIIILAAGKGTRLKITRPKPLVTLLGKSLIDYTFEICEKVSRKWGIKTQNIAVLGHDKEQIEGHLNSRGYTFLKAIQKEQLGTGHAVKICFEQLEQIQKAPLTFILCADTPLLTEQILSDLYEKIMQDKCDAVCASFSLDNPKGYGRIIKQQKGLEIREEKDANEVEKEIKEVNSGLYVFKTEYILKHIFKLKNNNKSNEFYLTDLFQKNEDVMACNFKNSERFLGVNDMTQLEEAQNILIQDRITELKKEGVRFINSNCTYLLGEVSIGKESLIYPDVVMEGKVSIGSNVIIERGVSLKDCVIGDNSIIKASSYILDSKVGKDCQVGPMAHLRPGTILKNNCKVGNFVEIKKSVLENGVKSSHLSYIGDAQIGENSNIGCGFITCNYDGVNKHKSIIGKDCFIGSDTQLIAPIELGDGVYIASGSTINKSIPNDSFAIAREKQTTKEGMAKKFFKKKKV